jgi:general nucleoside transport system permease protein
MLRLEPRAEPSRLMTLASPLLALALTALLAALILAAIGKDPIAGLRVIFLEPLANRRQVSEVLLKATPLIVIALGLAVCYRANVWNIGAEGQFLLGCVGGGGMALWLTALASTQGLVLPKAVAITLVLLAGMLGGALWAGLVALLRDRFNANEILVSLMLVYVAQQVVNALVFGPWKDPQGFNMPQSPMFHASLHLPPLLERTRLHVGFVVALVLAVVAALFLFRRWAGWRRLPRVMPAFRRGPRCGRRCCCRARWPGWRGQWRWPARSSR